MTNVQSPEIGSALRTALSLDAAGGLPLQFDPTIMPVAVVADVRELLTNKYIAAAQAGEQVAVLADCSYTGLFWDGPALPQARRILVDAVTVSVNTTSAVYWGFLPGGFPGTAFGEPRRKLASLTESNLSGEVVSSNSPSFPSVIISDLFGAISLLANTPLRLVFSEPIILDRSAQMFAFGTGSANVTLRSFWEWREER